MVPPGQRDYSSVRLSRHALERFVERFAAEPEIAADEFRRVLARTRRLGRNPENGAIAVLAIYRDQVLVAIVQQATCLTVLTWNQFVPRLAEFGRTSCPASGGGCCAGLLASDDEVRHAAGLIQQGRHSHSVARRGNLLAGPIYCGWLPAGGAGIDLGAKPRMTRQGACSRT